MNFKLAKNPSAIIGLIVVVGLGLVYFFFFSTPAQPPLTSTSVAGSTGVAGQNFAVLITRLSPITFDLKIFSDARFNALTDLATPIAPETTGRTDPFAPIAGRARAGGTGL
jgi:hypothetical protein